MKHAWNIHCVILTAEIFAIFMPTQIIIVLRETDVRQNVDLFFYSEWKEHFQQSALYYEKKNELCWFRCLPSGTQFCPNLNGREMVRLFRMAGLSEIVSFKFSAAWIFQTNASHNLPIDSQYLKVIFSNRSASRIAKLLYICFAQNSNWNFLP